MKIEETFIAFTFCKCIYESIDWKNPLFSPLNDSLVGLGFHFDKIIQIGYLVNYKV
jgi:hypothetical protein